MGPSGSPAQRKVQAPRARRRRCIFGLAGPRRKPNAPASKRTSGGSELPTTPPLREGFHAGPPSAFSPPCSKRALPDPEDEDADAARSGALAAPTLPDVHLLHPETLQTHTGGAAKCALLVR